MRILVEGQIRHRTLFLDGAASHKSVSILGQVGWAVIVLVIQPSQLELVNQVGTGGVAVAIRVTTMQDGLGQLELSNIKSRIGSRVCDVQHEYFAGNQIRYHLLCHSQRRFVYRSGNGVEGNGLSSPSIHYGTIRCPIASRGIDKR